MDTSLRDNAIFVGSDTDGAEQRLHLSRANRHGLIAGATGTGKTVTLQILAEGFSKAGVPVFAADVKGDLSGLSQSGSAEHKLHPKLLARAEKIGLDGYGYGAVPVVFWDLHGRQGHPVRTTISEMGPTLLARLMDLTDAQEGILNIAFDLADDQGWPLVDLKDLKALLTRLQENRKTLSVEYGNITSQSVGAILRDLLVLEREGADLFFGEPALKLSDLMRRDMSGPNKGMGIVNLLAADELINTPRLYSTFLLWLMSELFEELPEVGDPDQPVMAFFFDEAHLLFDEAPKALVDKIAQVARLIRSKGVSVFFVTQNPADIPDDVLGQLGNRIQHALRAYTPKEQKAVRAAAESFRPNPAFDTREVITELGTGEALVSALDLKGRPQVVGRTLVRPPASRLGPATSEERRAVMARSPVGASYDKAVDRESAHEMLAARRERLAQAQAQAEAEAEAEAKAAGEKKTKPKARGRRRKSVGEHLGHEAKLVARQLVRSEGRKLIRGLLGGLMRR